MHGTAAAPPTVDARRPGARWNAMGPTGGAVIALVVLVAVNAMFTPNFATVGNFWNVLYQLAVTLLVGVGMTFVIATGGIDLSVGSVMAVAAAVAAVTLDQGFVVAGSAALAAALAVGLLNGVFAAYTRVQPIVVTLATLLAGGRATILGTVVGALIMQVVATSFNMLLVPYAWSLAFKALIIVVAVYLQRPKRV